MKKSLNVHAVCFVAIAAISFWSLPGEVAGQVSKTLRIQTDVADDDPDREFAELPVGITSFGGAVADGHLYVYGGHAGTAHKYYGSGQNKTLYRLNLKSRGKWEAVHKSETGLQGLAMVAYKDRLYRLGGFVARNSKDEDQDLHSVTEFAVFDSKAKKWKALPAMPEPRSSFDAVVFGDSIFVIGGWKMQGSEPTVWSQTAWSIDLSNDKLEWKQLPQPPFQRRALSTTFHKNRIVIIGGMQKKGGPTTKVSFYDPQSKKWSEGPSLPGKPMEGFGNSSFNIGGKLIVSTYGGNVYQLSDDQSKWEKFEELDEGRFFHRLLPLSDSQFILVGGANMESGKCYELEAFSVKK